MAFSMQDRIPEDVYGCVQRMKERFNEPAYKNRHQEIISRAVATSKDILNKYQASEGKSLGEQHWFLHEYVQWILEKIKGVNKYNLPSILLQLRVLVKIFSSEEESPRGKKDELQKLQNQIDKLKKSLDEERVAKDELIQRLSSVAADRLKTGNPDIADLSDPNRPMKLAEKFNELYSNAWSDAYERLQKTEQNISLNSSSENSTQKPYRKPDSKTDDEDITQILFQALKSCYEWSQKAADCQKSAITKAGMGNIDFPTDLKSSSVGNQGPCTSEKSPGQINPQSQSVGNQGSSSIEKWATHVNSQSMKGGKQDEGTSVIKDRHQMSKSQSVGNQGSSSIEKWATHVNPQSMKGGKQDEGTSVIKDKHQMSKSQWVGDRSRVSSQKSPVQVMPLNSMRGNQRHGHSSRAPEEETPQAKDMAGAIHADKAKVNDEDKAGDIHADKAKVNDEDKASTIHADKARVKDEEVESPTLDNHVKEFMRCAGVESSKRLPEKICRKVMEDRNYQDIQAYIQECAELCWLMRIQFPPIELLFDIKPNDKFDHTYHRSYTISGHKIAFPVWPTMLLHKDGPVLAPGIVQCMKK